MGYVRRTETQQSLVWDSRTPLALATTPSLFLSQEHARAQILKATLGSLCIVLTLVQCHLTRSLELKGLLLRTERTPESALVLLELFRQSWSIAHELCHCLPPPARHSRFRLLRILDQCPRFSKYLLSWKRDQREP